MTISQQFVGTPGTGNTSASATVPSQCKAGSLLFFLLASKDEDASITSPPAGDWNLLVSDDGGGTLNGEVRLTVWWRVPTSDISGNSYSATIENTEEDEEVAAVIVGYTKDSGDGSWVTPPQFDLSEDSVDGNLLSFTFDNQNFTTGKVSCVLVAASDGGGSRTFNSHNISGCSTTDSSGMLGHPAPEALLTTSSGSSEFFSTWERTFSSNGFGAAGSTSLLYQGDPNNGTKHYSKCGFNKSDMQSTLSGKTITDVKLRLRNVHSWWNSGLDPARIGYHNHSSDPGGTQNTSGTFNVLQYHWDKFQTKSVDIPNSWGEAFKNGTRGGFTFGRTSSGNTNDYGYFDGDGSDRPRMTISWTEEVLRENPTSVFTSSRRVTSGTQSGTSTYEVDSTEPMSGVGIQIVIETITDEGYFISDDQATVEFFQTDTFPGWKEIQSLPGDQLVPGTETIFYVEFPVGLEGVVAEGADSFTIGELENPPVDEFSVVFNENNNNPGFIITIDGLLAIDQEYDLIDVVRRDLSGRYPDRRVRGMSEIIPTQNKMVVTDYEAPLNTVLEYYVRLTQGTATFLYGPAEPTPLPYIPIQENTYGEGLSYFKPIDLPDLSIPVQIEQMDTWTRPARVLADHQVLGRRNKVLVTDVRGGREGDLSGWIILSRGQTLDVFEAVINPGAVVLIQNHNPLISAYDDIYVQFSDISFERITQMVRYGVLDNPNRTNEVIIRFEASFTEVDRPNPVGVILVDNSWAVVGNTFDNWDSVRSNRDTFLELLKRPNGPDDDSS